MNLSCQKPGGTPWSSEERFFGVKSLFQEIFAKKCDQNCPQIDAQYFIHKKCPAVNADVKHTFWGKKMKNMLLSWWPSQILEINIFRARKFITSLKSKNLHFEEHSSKFIWFKVPAMFSKFWFFHFLYKFKLSNIYSEAWKA